jgi:hypothetical protein
MDTALLLGRNSSRLLNHSPFGQDTRIAVNIAVKLNATNFNEVYLSHDSKTWQVSLHQQHLLFLNVGGWETFFRA